tara:strand:- start:18 stop:509 length:492 start_codon:yes stop_codon:yes gene_type:complete
MAIKVRQAGPADADTVWALTEPVIRAGETYALPRDMSREDALDFWMGDGRWCFLAEVDGEAVGTYLMKANQMGGGDHVANCGYITSAAARGQGVAKALCEHSQAEAKRLGFSAMQFNFVVSTNTGAVRLWQRLGYAIVGTLPGAFRHPALGDVDVYVMFKTLT